MFRAIESTILIGNTVKDSCSWIRKNSDDADILNSCESSYEPTYSGSDILYGVA